MAIPICVVDANTLVDYIQDVKRWIYNGQLRLVVPSSTLENVEQIYQKSVEIKSTPKEPPRPRSSGKLAKKEFPAFDINPRLARTFLTRLKTWKEEDEASEQRLFLQEKENHEAVEFQQQTEQYAPWKDLEVEEEKSVPILDRPATWAEALRRKQALANGTPEDVQSSKGPVKPKLVAKVPGNDSSPWKIKKDAPKISAKEVPGTLRPLMSCALWRLHESVHRNDPNQLFLLCNQPEICAVAQKLNITVRSVEEIRHLMAAKADKTGLEDFGDLEKEFGDQLKGAKASATNCAFEEGGDAVVKSDGDNFVNHEERMNDSMSSGNTADTNYSHFTDEAHDSTLQAHGEDLTNIKPDEEGLQPVSGNGTEQAQSEEALDKSSLPLVEASIPEKSAWKTRSVLPVDKTHVGDLQKRLEAFHVTDGTTSTEDSRTSPWNAIDHNGQKAHAFIPKPTSPAISASQTQPATPIAKHATPSSQVINTQPNSHQITSGFEDSDEEEIVFKPQPKRYSAQRKPAQQNSRPSTPKTQTPQKPEDTRSEAATLKSQSQPQSKPVNHGRNTMVIGHVHPRPTSSPTVIDPDAFGRNFAVNTNPSPHGLHNPRSHHRPRSSAQSGQGPQPTRSPRRQNVRTSPPRQPQENAHQLSPGPEPSSERAVRTSPHRQSKMLDTETGAFRNVESFVLAQSVERQPSLPAPKQFETDDFVPRSSASNVSLSDMQPTPSMNRLRDYQTAGFVPRSQFSQTPFSSTALGPKVFEPSEFVPRSTMPATLYKPKAPALEPDYIEPRASMPDVEYVLKSGSTRASARGRGRLWTPS
ncbi:hypothetical protein N7G274_008935 [Stereocaulon virgatum]|uniref:PIN domain-containing protein n=1 Tax=Stereocaulon virgatum TaxID=373712 RepID=A0ABR3ZZZ6_9LECA